MSLLDFLLDPVHLAVSTVMRAWHALLVPAVDPSLAWVLAVVLLVVTVRVVLLPTAVAQLRAAAVMRRLAPDLAAVRARHGDDPVRMLRETTAVQRAGGASPWRTLLPALVQVPVLLSLLHVLQGFHPGSVNHAFDLAEVSSFLDARLLGVPLSAYLSMPAELLTAWGVDRAAVAAVAVPMLVLAAVATYLTLRRNVVVDQPDGMVGAVLRRLPVIAPLGAVLAGAVFPLSLGVLLYLLVNAAWTLIQQEIGQRWVDRASTSGPVPAAVPQRGNGGPRPGVVADPARRRRSRTGRRHPRRR